MSARPQSDSSSTNQGPVHGLVRFATQQAGRLPLVALTLGLEGWERSRPIRHAVLRNGAHALQLVAHTPLGRFLPEADFADGAEEEARRITEAVRETTVLRPPAETSTSTSEGATSNASRPAKKSAPTKAATPASTQQPAQEIPEAAREMGAPGAVTDEVEQVVEQLHVDEPHDRSELPISDFDNASLASLRGRLRSLSLEQLAVLREWEQAHAHRLPVITMLDNRIAKLAADQPATPAYPANGQAAKAEAETGAARQAAEGEGGTLRV